MKEHSGSFSLSYTLTVLAIVLFFLASVGYVWRPEPWPWNTRLIAAGLFCWSLSTIL